MRWLQSASKMDCSLYECVMNKQPVIEKLYFMLSRLVNEGCVLKGVLVFWCVSVYIASGGDGIS